MDKLSLVKLSLIAALSISLLACQDESAKIVEDKSEKQIVVESSKEYQADVVPKNMTVKEKKQRFISLVVPELDKVYKELELKYQKAISLVESELDNQWLSQQRNYYRVENNQDLILAIKPHPKSIALAQAAMESAWGTSRFFVKANNIFGVWSFDKDEPRIAAGEKRGDKTIWVKKYPDLSSSIRDYYKVLARGEHYHEFRVLKMDDKSPLELVSKLDRYSEKGHEYGEELAAMIRFNKFEKFDKAK